jgi:hypothetical protein
VEVAPGGGRGDMARPDHEVAEALAGEALFRIALDQRSQRRDDLVVAEVLAVELVQARAVERGAEIEVVLAGRAPDQADLGEVRPGAAVRATVIRITISSSLSPARSITASSARTRSGR